MNRFRSKVSWRKLLYALIASEISTISRYFHKIVQINPLLEDTGLLLALCDCPEKTTAESISDVKSELPDYTLVLLNGNLNHDFDIEGFLQDLHSVLRRTHRVIGIIYNPYFAWLYRIVSAVGLRKGPQPSTFITQIDLHNIAKLAGFEVVRIRHSVFFPFSLLGIGDLINRVFAAVPLLRTFGLVWLVVLRPIKPAVKNFPTLSIIIPARNEMGNIEAALTRMPDLGHIPEIIFVEGHSIDGTWEEIQRVASKYGDSFPIKTFRQVGKGKADAVRLGLSHSSSELLTILDADLTMPPELLGRFYNAWRKGNADFINGSRLVYPMEGHAMRFLNRLGNIFFAKALSAVLGCRIGDSLCGTKLFSKADYLRFSAWQRDFGDFDPFGDFELIFPAAILGLGIIDVPIRYRDRTYGSTNINRFRHGLMLLKMTIIGFLRIRIGPSARAMYKQPLPERKK